MSRVFIVQQPTGRDPRTGAIQNTMDLSPANKWGEPIHILRDWENPFKNPDATAEEVERIFEVNDFCEDDWLLLVGNPILIGIVASVATGWVDRLKMLQWSRADREYIPVEVQLPLI